MMQATALGAPAGNDPFGLLNWQIFQAPHETYHLLRYLDPVHWHEPTRSWVLTAYADIHALLNQPTLLSSAAKRPAALARLDEPYRQAMASVDDYLRHWLLDLDPPAHTPIRQALNGWFTGGALARSDLRIRKIAAELARRFVTSGGGNLVTDFAHPFPVRVIAELIGVPPDDYPRLNDWFARLSQFFERGASSLAVIDDAATVIAEVDEWLERLVAERRARARDDILSALAADPALAGLLEPRALRSTVLLLLFGGHESSRSTIANGMLALLQTPGSIDRLRAEPALIGPAVEEFLRFDGPFMRQDRVATEAFTLHGRRIAAGSRVVLVLGAANRDPGRFHAPDTLIVDRRDNRHLAFGHGIHFCLGSRLARMEIGIAVNALLKAAPGIKMGPRRYRWREHFNNRGLAELDVIPG